MPSCWPSRVPATTAPLACSSSDTKAPSRPPRSECSEREMTLTTSARRRSFGFTDRCTRFRGESSLKTYLVHIAMNLSINALRSRRRSLLRFVSRDEHADRPCRAARRAGRRGGRERAASARSCAPSIAARRKTSRGRGHAPVSRLLHTRDRSRCLACPKEPCCPDCSRAMKELETQLGPVRSTRRRTTGEHSMTEHDS